MKKQKFVYEITVEEFPHTKATAKKLLGGTYNSDFPIQTHANQLISNALREAYVACLHAEMDHLERCHCGENDMDANQKAHRKYLKENTTSVKTIMESVKFVRVEKSD
jgi:hypothetical protein